MKQNVTESRFINAFENYGRENQFSPEGLRALYNWITNMDDSCGIETELDVIALCCEFCEFKDFAELQEAYPDVESMDDLRDHTTVVIIDDESFIIQSF